MSTATQAADPIELLRQLSPEEIEARIAELHAEDAQLRTLLRSIRARERARSRLRPREIQREVQK